MLSISSAKMPTVQILKGNYNDMIKPVFKSSNQVDTYKPEQIQESLKLDILDLTRGGFSWRTKMCILTPFGLQ